MKGQSQTLKAQTSRVMIESISLPASVDGNMPCNSQVGLQTDMFGQAHAHVNRFRAQENGKGKKTKDTFGLSFTGLSPSAGLQLSLESRLRALTDGNGSPEYVLTWKQWTMQLGVPICALRASGRPTSGNGCTGWPSPQTADTGKSETARKGSENLSVIAGWATPTVQDSENCAAPSQFNRNSDPLNVQAVKSIGPTQSSSPAETEKRGVLNPALARWLMGYPDAWDSCGATAMQSCLKSRRGS